MRKLLLLLLLLLGAPARAQSPQADLYLLGIALDQVGAAGGWEQLGVDAGWQRTIAGAVIKGHLYTVESDGTLWRTALDSGTWTQVGQAEFQTTRFMFTSGGLLYTIEKSGSLYRVNPDTGAWSLLGKPGDWQHTAAGAVLNGRLYTVETNGRLYETDLPGGQWHQIGRAEFADTRFMFAARNGLYTIEKDGSLYWVNPRDGSWTRVGQPGGWKATEAGLIMRGTLYTTEKSGNLWRTDLHTGERQTVGRADFAMTRFMYASAGTLYTIESTGNLYRVEVKATQTLDAFDWCPQEMERLFKGQGFYRQLHSRQILGVRATHQEIMAGLAWLESQATPKDTVLLFIDAHGNTDPQEGWNIITADSQTLWGHQVKAELAKLPCPVLAMVETCTSGGFAASHPKDRAIPPNVMAVCACAPDQETNNQLDLAAGEALYGRADFNHDGVVDVDELCRYVEMRYHDWWPDPKPEEGAQTPVIARSRAWPGDRPLTRVSPQLCAVAVKNEFYSALLEGQQGDRYRVHLLGWSDRPADPYFLTDSTDRDSLCLPTDGPPLEALIGGHWCAARRVRREGDKEVVHLLGRHRDETVPRSHIRYPFAGQNAL